MVNKKKSLKIYKVVQERRDQFLAPLARFLISLGVTANQISLFRLVLVFPLFYYVGVQPLVAVLILIINYYVLDAIDGVVARLSGKSSKRGRAIDVSIDHFFVVPLVLSIIYYNLAVPFWAATYLVVQLIDYFVAYLRFGIEVGRFPFSHAKYWVYGVFLVWAVSGVDFFDYVFLVLSVYLFVKNIFSIKELYYGR